MAVPSAITDLTVDESTNFPPDTETVTATTRPSDYLRAHASILRRPWAKGADVASATAANLGSNTDGDYFHITGTTGIAASNFGTVDAGIERTIVFDGALLLTHNGTSFILPGAANITTAAGDVAVFRSEGSGNWRCVSYEKASGAPVDAELSAIAGLNSAANKVPRFTGSGTAEVIDVVYGTYTPTITAVLNIGAIGTVYTARYIRVGTVVTVNGISQVNVSSANALTIFRISLPVSSDIITANSDVSGIGYPNGKIFGDTSNNEAQIYFSTSGTGLEDVSWSFSYIIQ